MKIYKNSIGDENLRFSVQKEIILLQFLAGVNLEAERDIIRATSNAILSLRGEIFLDIQPRTNMLAS